MIVTLEFMDDDVRIHSEALDYTGMVPIPFVGDVVGVLESGGWMVKSREFYYWTDGQTKQQRAKVTFRCKQIPVKG